MIERRAVQESRKDWVLDRKIQISHILASVLAMLSAFFWLADMKRDVEILKVQQSMQQSVNSEAKREVNIRLDKIEAKVDRVLELQSRGRP